MAQHFNWKIKQIVILPFGGFCDVDEHGNRSMKEDLFVILAGPAQHIIIACLVPLFQVSGLLSNEYGEIITRYNLMILFFNLLPIRPLDGGKIIHLLFSVYKPYLQSFQLSLISSILMLVVFHILILVLSPFNLNIWLILLYLDICIWSEWKQQRYIFMRFLLERYYGRKDDFSQLKTLYASEEDYLYQVLIRFNRGCKHLIDVGGEFGQAKLDENELLHAFFAEKRVRAQLKDLVYEQE